jgi:hypothetical protein
VKYATGGAVERSAQVGFGIGAALVAALASWWIAVHVIAVKTGDFSVDFSNDFLSHNVAGPIIAAQPAEKQAEFKQIFNQLNKLPADLLYTFSGELATDSGRNEFCKSNGRVSCGKLTSNDVKPLIDEVVQFRINQASQDSASPATNISIISLVVSIFTFLMGIVKIFIDAFGPKAG